MTIRSESRALEPFGEFTTLDGERFYRISCSHRLPPFLMTLPSDSDLWMFVTSRGGLTAGRVDAEGALFAYETVDRLHDAHHHTGPVTLLRAGDGVLWAPFDDHFLERFSIERNLYKNAIGNRLVFEEINHDLQLAFRYRWSSCERFGFVRTATLTNLGARATTVELLDGVRNVLPSGAPLALLQRSSSLVDAYKRADRDPASRAVTYSLTSRIIDRAEAAEQLRANVVWSHGLEGFDVALDADALRAFRRGTPVPAETVLTGRRGNYLLVGTIEVAPHAPRRWHLVADVGRSHVDLAELETRVLSRGDLDEEIEAALLSESEGLLRNVGSADGAQLTGCSVASAHHFANVLFNNMRGGVFSKNYAIPIADFGEFLETRNRELHARHEGLLATLPEELPLAELEATIEITDGPSLVRLALEYLPLHFGRRHGDPSRPWNSFSIQVRKPDGSRALRYEGNWRDIFQNWEALAASFPRFLPGIVAKFVNASTVDGFNPYRITREGIDWETVDPDDPWSYIGYWGDHQIVYLLRLLEALERSSPGALDRMLARDVFTYADVPYRLRSYARIAENPHETIDYDHDRAGRVGERVRAIGADGKLVVDSRGRILHVNLLEKLLVPLLSKLSNFVPGAGIWMNTQRPEWNDANNALVGNGVSFVTMAYLRRYVAFLERWLEERDEDASISVEVVQWLRRIAKALRENRPTLCAARIGDGDRKRILDVLGEAFSEYRANVYANGLEAREPLSISEVLALLKDAGEILDASIRANRRTDGLYHSYHVLRFQGEALAVDPLEEMLEGQVAALGSGSVDPAEALHLVESLFASRLYRRDQNSFLLYPERELPAFRDWNAIPIERVREVPLLHALDRSGDRSLIERDALGVYRFHPDFRNARDVERILDRLALDEDFSDAATRDRRAVLDVFEEVFEHRTFTGRSGRMYGYEGIGCIYWHMVAKLLLAVQEVALDAERNGGPTEIVHDLARAYFRVRGGLGFEKTVVEYGAFPTDPYSHTPRHAGARQPGMTGQVKEEILTRLGEFGVRVQGGSVCFRPSLLREREFLEKPARFEYFDVRARGRSIELPAGSLAFSFCQVPIVYFREKEEAWIRVLERDAESARLPGNDLSAEQSAALLDRSGRVTRIEVGIPERSLLRG